MAASEVFPTSCSLSHWLKTWLSKKRSWPAFVEALVDLIRSQDAVT
jgi:hypothetical protein